MIKQLIEKEAQKQDRSIQLIASENFVSQEILDIQGSILTNKYAEGYPNARYYGGCEFIDQIEQLAIDKALEMFNNPQGYSANVQPHSGSQANQAVYLSVLEAGDTVLGMALDHGGHLTHGHKLSSSGILYNFISYGTKDNKIDYEQLKQLLIEHQPKLLVVGASAYPYTIYFDEIKQIVDEVSKDTLIMADVAHIAGLIVGGVHPTPFGYVDFVTSTTHKSLRGPRGGLILCKDQYIKSLNRSVFPGIQGGPLMHVIGAKAQCFIEACTDDYKAYTAQIVKNSKAFSEQFIKLGYDVIGTDNHLILIDVYNTLEMTGKDAQNLLEEHDIIVNKNTVPNDPLSPMITSGIRVGTPAMTTKGYKETDFVELANKIDQILRSK